MIDYRKKIIQFLNKELKENLNERILEVPPLEELGDYAFPCYLLSRKLKKSPIEISKNLENLKIPNFISKLKSKGPYLNFFLNEEKMAKEVLLDISKKKGKYGLPKKRKHIVVIESPGPNTNKPLHLGHIRNMVLGNSLVNIYNSMGNKTIRVDIVNDRGIHICKSMLAYKKFGRNKTPNKKPDHFVGDFYSLYSKKENKVLEKELNELLLKWENKDKEARALWKKMNKWAIKGINETYKKFGVKIDKVYYESDHYEKGKKIIEKGLNKKIFQKDEEGNTIIDLEDKKLGKKVVLRKDGTSVYITQDLALVDLRFKDFRMDEMIYIVANEQIYHFKVLFEILKRLNYKFSENLFHLAYGYISLPEGRIKSREGTKLDADNLVEEMKELAKKEILKRNKNMSKTELGKLSEIIGMAALKFFILKYNSMKDFVFYPKESIKFQGDTGVYILYTLVRTKSILKKSKNDKTKPNFELLKDKTEEKTIKILSKYPEIIQESARKLDPSIICNYLLDLSHSFNEFYHRCKVIDQKNKELTSIRLLLVKCVGQVIENALTLLNINSLERM